MSKQQIVPYVRDITTNKDVRLTGKTEGDNVILQTMMHASDSPSIDAFGRWRVSNPETLFDSKNIFNDSDLADSVENQDLFYDNQETSGSGTSTTYDANKSSQTLLVSNTTAGTRVRQTKMRFNYQPGKSQEVMMTFNMNGAAANITKKEGIFDGENGIFLEFSGTTVNLVRRTFVTGSAVDTKVAQANWNLDVMDGTGRSKVTLNWSKTQIMFIDFEWLGVGRIRIGFVVNGMIYYVHEINNANSLAEVYMTTPNLPLRSEISNDGSGAADTITQICSTVVSEGGSQELGVLRHSDTASITSLSAGTTYAILGLRLKSNYLGASVLLQKISMIASTNNDQCHWGLYINPTVASTFAYSDESRSAIQTATGAAANTITNGYEIDGDFFSTASPASHLLKNALRLGSLIDGTVDEIVLTATPITNNITVQAGITWRELI